MNRHQERNVIVIGSGPAGHTAAIYAARANLKPLMFEGLARGGIPGGQLMITNDVENYPGFPEKIAGPDLMQAFRDQSLAQGVEVLTEDVHEVDLSRRPFRVWAGDERASYSARAVVIATGAQAKWIGLESERALRGKGVSACAVCDGAFFRNQDVVIVGGGDTAMEEATYLSGMCRSVMLVHRRAELRASKTMQSRVLCNPKIRVVLRSVVEEVLDVSRGEVTGARVRDIDTNVATVLPCTGLLRRHRAHAQHGPIFAGSSSSTTAATFEPGPGPRTRASRASSPAATCRTSPTGKPSRRPAAAAWQRSTRSAGSAPSTRTSPRKGTARRPLTAPQAAASWKRHDS